jgi:hypothetical protein
LAYVPDVFWVYVRDLIHSDILQRFTDTQAKLTAVSISHSALYSQSPTPTKHMFFEIVCGWSWPFWQCSCHSVGIFDGEHKTKHVRIIGITARHQGCDGVLQHCKSAI